MKTLALVLGAGIALSACTTMGTGTGSVAPGGEAVQFSWRSTDGGVSGTMSAALKDGQTFSGPYLQVTSTTQSQALEPMWNGWEHGWGGWGGFGGFGTFPDTTFTTHYSGRAMANLQTADGQHMRCHFHLNHPDAGMGGGGQGQCQLKSGRSVDAVFPPSA
ncbi:MAG TPA: hypothetical protein VEQ87_24640 [Burkholderiales bacterium]|nr:hypothetical protein [Burkholderiales bacterium]